MSNDRSPSLSSPWDIPEVSFEGLEVQCSIHCHCISCTPGGRVQFSRNNLIVVRSCDRTVSVGYNRSYCGQDLPTNIVPPFRPILYGLPILPGDRNTDTWPHCFRRNMRVSATWRWRRTTRHCVHRRGAHNTRGEIRTPVDRVIINNDIVMTKNRRVYLSSDGWGFRRISKFPVHWNAITFVRWSIV